MSSPAAPAAKESAKAPEKEGAKAEKPKADKAAEAVKAHADATKEEAENLFAQNGAGGNILKQPGDSMLQNILKTSEMPTMDFNTAKKGMVIPAIAMHPIIVPAAMGSIWAYKNLTKIPPFSLIERGRKGLFSLVKASLNLATIPARYVATGAANIAKVTALQPAYNVVSSVITAPRKILEGLLTKGGELKNRKGEKMGIFGGAAYGVKGLVKGIYGGICNIAHHLGELFNAHPYFFSATALALIGTGGHILPLAAQFVELLTKAIGYGIAHIP